MKYTVGGGSKPISYTIDENDCHNCVSHKAHNGTGYTAVSRNKKRWPVSRFIYTVNKGEIPPGLVVRHTCDNRVCINPDHLILGTKGDNNRDRAERGRSRNQNGSKNNMAKLSECDVLNIFRSKKSAKYLSKKYGVSKNSIWLIKAGKRWRNILAALQDIKAMQKKEEQLGKVKVIHHYVAVSESLREVATEQIIETSN